METLWGFLSHTPIYVYFIFIYLVVVGFLGCKDREVYFYKIIIVTGVFLYLSVNTMIKFDLGYLYYTLFLLMIISSCYVGCVLEARKKISINKNKMLISLPGSWLSLFLVIFIFSTKYYLGYRNFQDSSFVSTPEAKLIIVLSSGFSAGLPSGRLMNYIYRFKTEVKKDIFS